MKEQKCSTCLEAMSLDEFDIDYKGRLNSRCRECGIIYAKDFVKRLGGTFKVYKQKTSKDHVSKYDCKKPRFVESDAKQYDNYMDDAVERGEMSVEDGEYNKRKNKNAIANGLGKVFSGKLNNKL